MATTSDTTDEPAGPVLKRYGRHVPFVEAYISDGERIITADGLQDVAPGNYVIPEGEDGLPHVLSPEEFSLICVIEAELPDEETSA